MSKEGEYDAVLIPHVLSSTTAPNYSQKQNEGSPAAAASTHLSILFIAKFYTDQNYSSNKSRTNFKPGNRGVTQCQSLIHNGASGLRSVFGAASKLLCICNLYEFQPSKNVPWLRRLIAGLSTLRPEFDSGPMQVIFVNHVAMGQIFIQLLWFSPVTIIPPMLHRHLYTTFIRRISGRNLETYQSYTNSGKNSSSVLKLLIASRMSCRWNSKTNVDKIACTFVSRYTNHEHLGTSLNIPSTEQNIFQRKLSHVLYDHSLLRLLWRAHNNAFCLPTRRAVLVIFPKQMFDCVWGGRSSETDRPASHENIVTTRGCRDILWESGVAAHESSGMFGPVDWQLYSRLFR